MLPKGMTYAEVCERFRWDIPEFYNIGVDVCDRWAAAEPERTALIDVRDDCVHVFTFAELQRAFTLSIVLVFLLMGILFESVNRGSAADWQYLGFSDTTILTYATIRYADKGVFADATSPTVQHCTIQGNTHGIYLNGSASPTLTNNTVSHNTYGIYIVPVLPDPPNPTISNNFLMDNSSYNLYAQAGGTTDYSSVIITAENNWWGTAVPAEIELPSCCTASTRSPAVSFEAVRAGGVTLLSHSTISGTELESDMKKLSTAATAESATSSTICITSSSVVPPSSVSSSTT